MWLGEKNSLMTGGLKGRGGGERVKKAMEGQ